MKTNTDTIRKALERLKGFTYHAADSQDADDIKTLIAALSTIEADAKPQEPSGDAEAFCKRHQYLMSPKIIQAHDDAIRREYDRYKDALRKIATVNRAPHSYMTAYAEIVDEARAILATEPAREETKRCDVCGWPLVASRDKGCVEGDCSMRPVPKQQEYYWWCPECKQEVDGSRVTFEEYHDSCGCKVISKRVPAREESE